MTSAPITHNTGPLPERGVQNAGRAVRLRLKPGAATTGFVDGAWWPYSRDLLSELPVLVRVLGDPAETGARMLRVERVSYNLGVWDPTDGKIDVDGLVVRLGGYRSQDANTVDLIGHHHRLTLLVVPPETAVETGYRTLITAAEAGNASSIAHLLHAGPAPLPVDLASVEVADDDLNSPGRTC
jgi:hypothetical protein